LLPLPTSDNKSYPPAPIRRATRAACAGNGRGPVRLTARSQSRIQRKHAVPGGPL